MMATDDRFAPAIISQVKKSVVDELDGEAGWRVVSVNQNGSDVDVLNEVAPVRPRRRSRSAWTGPSRTPRRTPSTWWPQGDDRGDQAVHRRDPRRRAERRCRCRRPARRRGSTRRGRRSRSSPRAPRSTATWRRPTRCSAARARWTSATHDAQLRRIRPGHRADVTGVRELVQHHVRRAGQQDAAARAHAAARSTASGPDYVVDGLTTVTGSVPPTVNLTERTEDGFGQGKVLVSPFGMALVAATVAAGKTPVPQLIEGGNTEVTGERRRSRRR